MYERWKTTWMEVEWARMGGWLMFFSFCDLRSGSDRVGEDFGSIWWTREIRIEIGENRSEIVRLVVEKWVWSSENLRMASLGGASQEPDIFEIGNVIDDQYVISARLGKGGYGEIYRATSIKDGSIVAVKVERASKSGNLHDELSILNTLTRTSLLFLPSLSLSFLSLQAQNLPFSHFLFPSLFHFFFGPPLHLFTFYPPSKRHLHFRHPLPLFTAAPDSFQRYTISKRVSFTYHSVNPLPLWSTRNSTAVRTQKPFGSNLKKNF